MSTKKAVVKQVSGITFTGKSDSNHWVIMDGPENFNGNNAGTRPKELVLLGLGGCTGSDVVSILKKKRVNLDDFEIRLTAESTDEHPQVFTKINIEYVFYGKEIKVNDVERAIELSMTKYCSVSAMLRKAVELTHNYQIIENKSE